MSVIDLDASFGFYLHLAQERGLWWRKMMRADLRPPRWPSSEKRLEQLLIDLRAQGVDVREAIYQAEPMLRRVEAAVPIGKLPYPQ